MSIRTDLTEEEFDDLVIALGLLFHKIIDTSS